jgi:hypothetical protein
LAWFQGTLSNAPSVTTSSAGCSEGTGVDREKLFHYFLGERIDERESEREERKSPHEF